MKQFDTEADKVRVLLVDDNQQFLTSVQRFLQNETWIEIVGTSTSGQELLNHIDILHPDLVLMDIALPDANGLDLTRQLQQTTQPLRVIVMTVYERSVYGDAAAEAGADGFVTKDAFGIELLPLIQELFKKQDSIVY